jgi:Zn-dependent protease/CBS domain-containing protein
VNPSFELGRVAGIRIGVNWSWLVVFALIVWSLDTTIFPSSKPGLSDGTYLAMALVAAVIFFASLLAHELGHAIQARREGMEIEGITLWLFGGVARFRGMFPSAGAELRIALAGPVVSLVLGVLFVLTAVFAPLPDEAQAVAAWLGYINLLLLLFNMLPALPLDGGRVLRASIWVFRGDFGAATRIAAGVGRGFGFLFIAGGVLLAVLWNEVVSGLWFAFIGWFLLSAVSAESRILAVRDAFGGLRVRDLMVREPDTVDAHLTLGEFMDDVVWQRRHTTYPVVEGGIAVGLLPFRRVAEVPRSEWDERLVRDCMIPRSEVPQLMPDESLVDALVELSDGIGRGLVLGAENHLVGFLSVSDLMRALELGGMRRPVRT